MSQRPSQRPCKPNFKSDLFEKKKLYDSWHTSVTVSNSHRLVTADVISKFPLLSANKSEFINRYKTVIL